MVELKAVIGCNAPNYRKATGLRLCLLLNRGGPRRDIEREANGLMTARGLYPCFACICALICL